MTVRVQTKTWCKLLFEIAGQAGIDHPCYEVRALHAGEFGTVAGVFDDPQRMAEAIAELDGMDIPGSGVYATLNPVHSRLLEHGANRLRRNAKHTASDRDIVRRTLLLVDVDPKRASNTSSTYGERMFSLAAAALVQQWLFDEFGMVPIAWGASGNGSHTFYMIDLPNDDASRDLVSRCLKAIAKYADHELTKRRPLPDGTTDDPAVPKGTVDVDISVGNAARICKPPGVMARKGSPSDERPHRRSGLFEPQQLAQVRPDPEVVTLEQLLALAATLAPTGPRAVRAALADRDTFDAESFILRHVSVKDPRREKDGAWFFTFDCPFNGEHKDASAGQKADGRLYFNCFHHSCQGYSWQDFRELFDPKAERKVSPFATLASVVRANSGDVLEGRALRYSEFDDREMLDGSPVTDADLTRLRELVAKVHGLALSAANASDIVSMVARERPFHPVRDWLLSGQPWDGIPRIKDLVCAMAVEPTALNVKMVRCALLGGVARAMKPGSKADSMLVLCGQQGVGKSRTVKALSPFSEWVLDTPLRIGPGQRDALEAATGRWILEITELASLRKSEREDFRSWIASPVDSYRKAYGRRTEDHPRSWFAIGTTNTRELVDDADGERRFWPLLVYGQMDVGWIEKNRQAIWSEMVAAYGAGERWHLLTAEDEAELRRTQAEQFAVNDLWEPLVAEFLQDPRRREGVRLLEVLEHIGMRRQDVHTGHYKRIARLMRRAKWSDEKGHTRTGTVWRPCDSVTDVTVGSYKDNRVSNPISQSPLNDAGMEGDIKHRLLYSGEGSQPSRVTEPWGTTLYDVDDESWK